MFKRICTNTAVAVLLCLSLSVYAVGNNEAALNPAFSLILSGAYGNLQRDPAIPATGFRHESHSGPRPRFQSWRI